MSKLLQITTDDGGVGFAFYCPGCKCYHYFQTEKGPRYTGGPIWAWNGNIETPTFSPSILVRKGDDHRCHLFVNEGKLQYLEDSLHELSGQTVEMLEA